MNLLSPESLLSLVNHQDRIEQDDLDSEQQASIMNRSILKESEKLEGEDQKLSNQKKSNVFQHLVTLAFNMAGSIADMFMVNKTLDKPKEEQKKLSTIWGSVLNVFNTIGDLVKSFDPYRWRAQKKD